MKLISLVLITSLAFGCHTTGNQPDNTSGKDSAKTSEQTALQPTERERLITALRQLQSAVASQDKKALADYFQFPINNEDFQLMDIDSALDKEIEQNHGFITRSMFLKGFNTIYENQEMATLADPHQLLRLSIFKDTATKEARAEMDDKACKLYYNITLQKDTVTIEYGAYNNEEYLKKHPNQPEDECPEYAGIWTFIFDGKRLIFNLHLVAG